MRPVQFTLIVMLALPATVHAQRGGDGQRGGQPPGGSGGVMTRQAATPELSAKDLVSLNPARIPVDRQKDLALSVDQAVRLDSIARAYDLDARDFAKAIDSLQNIMSKARRNIMNNARSAAAARTRDRPTSARDSIERARSDSIDQMNDDKEQERYRGGRNGLASTLLTIREAYDTRLGAINAFLNDEQRRKIGPWFESASDELTTRLHWANVR